MLGARKRSKLDRRNASGVYHAWMESRVRILKVAKDEDDSVIMTFSDGTWAAYLVEELIELRPHSEPVSKTIPIHKPVKLKLTKPVP